MKMKSINQVFAVALFLAFPLFSSHAGNIYGVASEMIRTMSVNRDGRGSIVLYGSPNHHGGCVEEEGYTIQLELDMNTPGGRGMYATALHARTLGNKEIYFLWDERNDAGPCSIANISAEPHSGGHALW